MRSKLKGRIIERYGTYGNFAAAIGQSSANINRVTQGRGMPKAEDLPVWCEKLGIDSGELFVFFADKVPENEQ